MSNIAPEHLDFDCTNKSCPRRGFCQRTDWLRGFPHRAWRSCFSGGRGGRPCPWFVPTEHVNSADVQEPRGREILRCLNDLRRSQEGGNA